MYYDTKSGQRVPLCNRPNCNHDEEECNASFNRTITGKDGFVRTFVQYYEGAVYIFGHDPEHNVNLYQVAADGSFWKKYMTIYKADMTPPEGSGSNSDAQSLSWTIPHVQIHRGYVYYVLPDEKEPKLRRIALGGTETEVLCETTGKRAVIDWMKIYGEYVFFRAGNYTDEN